MTTPPMKRASIIMVAFIATFLSTIALAQDSDEEAILITGARIFDGVADNLIDGQDVLVENGLIAAVGENLEAPDDARVIDANGRTLMPGLSDMHAHLMFQMSFGKAFSADREYWAYVASAAGEQYLMQGFTVVRDAAATRSR